MTVPDKLVFNDYDTLNGPPIIDGFAMPDPGVVTNEVDGGYINGGRLTLGSSSGLPPVVIQVIREVNTIVFGIMCRGDTSFDDIDGVVIGLRQNGTSTAGVQRKIQIFPMWGDATGITATNLGTGFGAADPDPDPFNAGAHLSPAADDPLFQIRKNRPPHFAVEYYGRNDAGVAWATANPSGKNDPSKFNVRTRSWWPPASPQEYAWSVEVRVPINNAIAGGDWLDLDDDFGLFIDVIRGFRYVNADGDPDFGAAQYTFPIGADPLTPVAAATDIPPTSFGHGLMGGQVANGEGVRIKNGWLGIGRRAPGSPPGDPLTGEIRADQSNELIAQIENTGPAAGGITAQIWVAQFGLYSHPDYYTPDWQQPTGLDNPSTPAVSVPAGTLGAPSATIETKNIWNVSAGDLPFYTANSHQCIWVQLDSSNPSVTFTQASVHRNMDFAGLSAITRDVVISGEGYHEPADGSGVLDFLLFTRCRKLVVRELMKAPPKTIDPATVALVNGALLHNSRERIPGPFDTECSTADKKARWGDSVVYLWITEGFLFTGKRTVINGIDVAVVDPSPGDFSICAHHEGVDDPFSWAFSGGGMVQHRPGVYGIKVPYKGKTTINVRLAAGPLEPAGDQSRLPQATELPGCRALLMRLIERYGIWGLVVAVLVLLLLYWLFG